MDPELHTFLQTIERLSEENKKLAEIVCKNTEMLGSVVKSFEQLSQGDARMKIYPLNVTLTRIAIDLEALVMEIRMLLNTIHSMNKVPALFNTLKKFLK